MSADLRVLVLSTVLVTLIVDVELKEPSVGGIGIRCVRWKSPKLNADHAALTLPGHVDIREGVESMLANCVTVRNSVCAVEVC
jgi:hypothetical protein